MDRRSFLRGSLFAPLVTTVVPVAKAAAIDDDCFVDWELLDEQRDVWVDDDVNSEGFELEIGTKQGSGRYLGRIAWWILAHEDDDRSKALLNGVASCQASEIYQDCSIVTVKF